MLLFIELLYAFLDCVYVPIGFMHCSSFVSFKQIRETGDDQEILETRSNEEFALENYMTVFLSWNKSHEQKYHVYTHYTVVLGYRTFILLRFLEI